MPFYLNFSLKTSDFSLNVIGPTTQAHENINSIWFKRQTIKIHRNHIYCFIN